MLLQLRDITKTYRGARDGDVHALQGLSLDVDAGQFAAVQGPSGCGKSTLLLIAGGLLMPDAGQVRVAGQDIYALGPEQRARFRGSQIGFVFQQFHLVPYLSVLDNVLAPLVSGSIADPQRRALDLIERFGLTARAHHKPAELSSGERQRTALARALLASPKALLADEPTGNLDRDNAEAVLGYLAEFAREGGAVLLVTHDPLAARYAHTITKIEQGHLVETVAGEVSA